MRLIKKSVKAVLPILMTTALVFSVNVLAATQALTPITVAEFKQTNIQMNLNTAQNILLTTWQGKPVSALHSQQIISGLNASFIKVYFSKFNLPDGAYVTVSNRADDEVYTYGSVNKDDLTFDPAQHEDGIHQFASMSITGDTAIVSLVITKPDAWVTDQHGITISRYSEGYPLDQIEALINGQNNSAMINQHSPSIFSTCGANQRRDAVCYQGSHPTEFARSNSVARVLIGGSRLCTSWRVGDENRMMTNNHCAGSASEVSSTESWFNYQRTSCGGSSNGTVTKVSGNQMLSTNSGLDYTLYTVNNFSSIVSFGNLGLDVRAPSLGEEIYIAQHGSGNPKELAIESDQNQGNVCRVDDPSTTGTGSGPTDIGYFCDTIGGSSGSPVLARSTHKVVALHHLGGCHNKGARINEIWPRISNFFPNGIPPGSGGGGNPAPQAKFTYSINGLSVNFTDQSTDSNGTVVSWLWDFGDNQSSTQQSPSHTYAAEGQYAVKLTVTDNDGASNSTNQQVNVGSTGNELKNGVPVTGLSGNTGEMLRYTMQVPANAIDLVFTINGGSGDADLYVRYGAEPTTSVYDCRPYLSGNSETCNINNVQEGVYHVMLRGYSAFSGVTLTGSHN